MSSDPIQNTELQRRLLEAANIVDNDVYSYEGYTELIQTLYDLDNSPETLATLLRMSETLMLSLEQYELMLSIADPSSRKHLYKQALADHPTPVLWIKYAEFMALLNKKKMIEWTEVCEELDQGLNATKWFINEENKFFEFYIQLLTTKRDNCSSDEEKRQLNLKMKQMYLKRLTEIHTTVEETFSDYSSFISATEPENYELELPAANKIYLATLKLADERRAWETSINFDPTLEDFAAYIYWESTRPKKQLKNELVVALYERTLEKFTYTPQVWDDYILYLSFNVFPNHQILKVTERAVKACPAAGDIWAHRLRLSDNETKEILKVQIDEIPPLQSNFSELQKVLVPWLFYLRKEYSSTGTVEFLERFIYDAVMAMQMLEATDSDLPSSSISFEMFLINQYTILSEASQAREIWQSVTKRSALDASQVWVKWAQWEAVYGDYNSVVEVYEKALKRVSTSLEWTDWIMKEYIDYESSNGTFHSIQTLLGRYSLKIKQLQYQQVKSQEQDEIKRAQKKQKQKKTKELLKNKPATVEVTIEDPIKDKLDQPFIQVIDDLSELDSMSDSSLNEKKRPIEEESAATQAGKKQKAEESFYVLASGLSSSTSETDLKNAVHCDEILISIPYALLTYTSQAAAQAATSNPPFELKLEKFTTSLWISNFPKFTEAKLREFFNSYVPFQSLQLPGNKHRRFCYLHYHDVSTAFEAYTQLAGLSFEHLDEKYTLLVKPFMPRSKSPEIIIKGIDYNVTEPELRKALEPFGPIERLRLPSSGKNRHDGYAFVVLDNPADAIQALNQTKLGSRTLQISYAQPTKGPTITNSNSESHSQRTQNKPKPAKSEFIYFDNSKSIDVFNIPVKKTDSEVRELFSECGQIAKFKRNKYKTMIEFEAVQEMGRAMLLMDGREVDGSNLKVVSRSR